MQTLYIKLVPLEKQFVELRYAFGEPAKYEIQRLDVSSINTLIQKSRSSYYMLVPDLKGIGHQLFCWLDGNGRWLSRAIKNCRDEGLTLAIDVRERLGYLPWETLHDGTQFLVERVNPVIVPIRWVDRPVQDLNDIQQRPLRLLFMATSPDNVEPSLDFEQEEAQILTTTRDIPLDLRVEESGCMSELSKLWGRYTETIDVFHLTGHASIEDGQPFFRTETETGECHNAYAPEIATALRFRRPQLVFLSGCRTGESPNNGAIFSLAESLIEQGGCRTVLGWGRAVIDQTATKADAHLYSKLAAGYQVAEALASTYQHLINAKVEDWHLLRLYIEGQCPKALVKPLGDQVWLPEEPIHEKFLDSQGIVRVATAQEFVGRRRIIQRSLKALRVADKLGIIIHGLGGIGKSSVAARLLERLHGYDEIFIYRQLDEDKLLRQLAEQCLSESGQDILQGKLPLTLKLTKFLQEGLNKPEQRLIFVIDDFEANLELRTDGIAVLNPDVVTVLMALLKSISQSRLPHRVIITSRYNFSISELDQRLHREQVTSLTGTDLQKKCKRLISFAPNSEVAHELQTKALDTSAGNPRLLEWLDKLLQVPHLNKEKILEEVEKSSTEFRESILAEELLNRQPIKLRRMLGFCLVYNLPVPESAIKVLCPTTFDIDSYISISVSLGLLEQIHSKEGVLYYVPRILEPILTFPEDSIELYQTAVEHLDKIWLVNGFQQGLTISKDSIKGSKSKSIFEYGISTDRLFELYRLGAEGINPDVLIRANWILVMRLHQQRRYREVIILCKFVCDGAFGHLGIHLVSPSILYYMAKAQEHLGEVEDALQNYKEALNLCSEQSKIQEDSEVHRTIRASILHDLADLHEKQGNFQEAFKLCSQVIEIEEFTDDYASKAKSFNQLANIMQGLGKKEEALKIFKEAYKFAQKSENQTILYAVQNNLSNLQFEMGGIDAWDNFFEDVVSHESISQDIEVKISLLNNAAALHLRKGEIENAREIFNELNDLLPEIDDSWKKAAFLHNIATFRSDWGDREIALNLYNQALELHEKNGDQIHQAITLQEIGTLYDRENNIDKALKFLEESYQLSLKIPNEDIQANVLLRIAGILINQDRLDSAEEKINIVLGLPNTIKVPERYALAQRDMGRIQIKQKNYAAGESFLRQALEKCSLVINIILRASILKLLGQVLSFKGEIDEALKFLTESLDIYRKINLIEDIEAVQDMIMDTYSHKAFLIYEMAVTQADQGNRETAIELISQALHIVKKSEDEELKACMLLSWGNLLIDKEDFEIGISKVSQALEIAEEQNLSRKQELQDMALVAQYGKARELIELSQEKCENKDFDAAIAAAQKCMTLAELTKNINWASQSLSWIGQIKTHLGDYENGIQYLERAIALVQENYLDGVEDLQEIIFKVNNYEAVRLYEQALSAARPENVDEAIKLAKKAYEFQCSVNNKETQPATLCLLGQLLVSCNQPEEGLKNLYQALDIAKELQDQDIVDQVQVKITEFTVQ